ncbi:MAG: MarR family winged helix-turn-helix transcriptional regulator [Ilumatobacteraceae bacterium]
MPSVLRSDAALASSLRLSVMRLARRLRLERSGDDRTLNQLAVLGTLDRHGPQSVGQLAAIEKVKPPSMTRTIACLEDAGLVVRRPHAHDGRQIVVELTPAAHEVLNDDRRRRDAWLALRLGVLAPEDIELLQRVAPLLERLAGS